MKVMWKSLFRMMRKWAENKYQSNHRGRKAMNGLRKSDAIMLEAFSSALSGKRLTWSSMPEEKIWSQIYRNAQKHKIFPMIMETVSRSDFFANDPSMQERYYYYLRKSQAAIYTQAQRSADFLLIYDYLLQRGLKPLVMKGIVCRNLYMEPEHRPSGDEDLLVEPQDFPAYHQAMLDFGMELVNPEEDIEEAHEVAYRNKETLLYIEVHKCMFSPKSEIFGDWNRYFDCTEKNCMRLRVYGFSLYTLDPTTHLLYLILHAFKHFLHGGCGIRQIADIALFSEAYQDKILWESIEQIICEVNAKDFVRAIFKITAVYLRDKLPSDKLFPGWDFSDIDELPLLQDVMEGGAYGTSTLSRQHSSNMTLDAVAARHQKRRRRGVWHSLFPGKNYLQSRFIYAKKYPVLLPVAWGQRIIEYFKRSGLNSGNPAQTIQIGQARIKLLEKYKII